MLAEDRASQEEHVFCTNWFFWCPHPHPRRPSHRGQCRGRLGWCCAVVYVMAEETHIQESPVPFRLLESLPDSFPGERHYFDQEKKNALSLEVSHVHIVWNMTLNKTVNTVTQRTCRVRTHPQKIVPSHINPIFQHHFGSRTSLCKYRCSDKDGYFNLRPNPFSMRPSIPYALRNI